MIWQVDTFLNEKRLKRPEILYFERRKIGKDKTQIKQMHLK